MKDVGRALAVDVARHAAVRGLLGASEWLRGDAVLLAVRPVTAALSLVNWAVVALTAHERAEHRRGR